jgi:hypothetical protein
VNARIDAYLDGELPLEALTPEERAAAESILAAGAALRERLPAAPADLQAMVMGRINELGLKPEREPGVAQFPAAAAQEAAGAAREDAGARARRRNGLRVLVETLWQPQEVSFAFRPAWAALLVLAAGLAVTVPAALRQAGGNGVVATAPAPPVFVQFRLDAAGAGEVRLAGSFTGWEPAYDLVETQAGVWTVVVALEPGVHDYAFLVDGEEWVVDPTAQAVDDGFGGTNSRLALLPAS